MSGRRLPAGFLAELRDLEGAYLTHFDAIKQSGFHGGAERWRRERGLILDAVDADGDFLDVGCANGYLAECLVEWAAEKGVGLDPYGVDQGAGLIGLARARLPHLASHFWVGNAWDWTPPRRFRYVYTLADCVPEVFLKDYIPRLLRLFVEQNGLLIVGSYGNGSRRQPAMDVASMLADLGIQVSGSAMCGDLPISRVAWTKRL